MNSAKTGITLAVVGCGYWGRNLVRNFYELSTLTTICDEDSAKLESLVDRYPGVAVERNFENLLGEDGVQALVIATPAEQHFPMVLAALQAGKDVFVEKPLAMKLSEAEQLCDLARRSNRILMVGHLLNYHPAVTRLKQLVDSGYLGTVRYIYSHRLNLGKVRREENILWSFAPHDISVILSLLNDDPELVTAVGGNYLQPNIHDVTLTSLKFRSGITAYIHVSWLHPFKEQRLVVIGDKKMVVFEDTRPGEKLRVYDRGVDWIEGEPVLRDNNYEVIDFSPDEPLKKECLQFLQCVQSRKLPPTDGAEGVRVLRVLERAQQSLLAHDERVFRVRRSSHHDETKPYYVHPTAVVDEPCEIGVGTRIWHYSHVMKNARIGAECELGQNVFVASDVVIGNNVEIQNNVSVYEGVTLEDYVFCGPSIAFTKMLNPCCEYPEDSSESYTKTLVKRGASIGANATIFRGSTIGRYAWIGAGVTVTRDVPDYALVIGNPGKVVGWICECGTRLSFAGHEARCKKCRKRYHKSGPMVRRLA